MLRMGGLFSPRLSICVRPLVMLPLVHSSEATAEKRCAAVGSFSETIDDSPCDYVKKKIFFFICSNVKGFLIKG